MNINHFNPKNEFDIAPSIEDVQLPLIPGTTDKPKKEAFCPK
jgi:hypothetical protein